MFDFSWVELLAVGAVAVVAIGPKELPTVMRTLGRAARRMQYMKYALSQQFDDFMRDQDLADLRRDAHYRPSVPGTDEAAADEDPLRAESPQAENDDDGKPAGQ
jgi:sec-independent protein translocase protein TatB